MNRAFEVTPKLERRFWSKVNKTDTCWLWTASCQPTGYGQFRVELRTLYAHRVAYELVIGPIPEGLTLDHLCHTNDPLCLDWGLCPHRRCVNPSHLEPVTMAVNALRGNSLNAQRARQTHCKYGHPLSGGNLYVAKNGNRVCRICRRRLFREWKAAHA